MFIIYNIISPGCQVIIQKLSGCDWLQCTQCKMEICVNIKFIRKLFLFKLIFKSFSFSGQRVVLDGVQVVVVTHQVDVDVE